ncbi:hypothetical protein AC249_AIPGENE16782 [Exaiptasia diaphana]|nr:hypothetical protein AC249_AIPGENE16782 [Exaiptasia diaphana]
MFIVAHDSHVSDESDEDYQPTSKEPTESGTDEDTDFEYKPPSKAAKRPANNNTSEKKVKEGLFVATASSMIELVDQFNLFFVCPSMNGSCKGGLLYYGHLSMRGADRICNEELWQGTAKAAEGHLAQVLWSKAKEEELKVEINWQDADSSSALGFRYVYPTSTLNPAAGLFFLDQLLDTASSSTASSPPQV